MGVKEDLQQAENILRGQVAEPRAMLELAGRLRDQRRFGLARRILGRARRMRVDDAALRLKLGQQHALCTNKDPDLPAELKLERAFDILQEVEPDLAHCTDPETLGIAGGIFKRRWEVDGQAQHLLRSLSYYRRGYEEGDGSDYGYTGINAAFMLDLLADREAAEAQLAGNVSETADDRRAEARAIREELVARLPGLLEAPGNAWLAKEWWFFSTIAEAYFGLARYREARPWLEKAAALPDVPDWHREATARQLAAIARLQEHREKNAGPSPSPVANNAAASGTGANGAATSGEEGDCAEQNAVAGTDLEGSTAWDELHRLLGHDTDAVRSAFMGKVGLALSGGGFRASLFHIGVLARLAELDMLRHIEVLSCVSGGSIIGAHYYLEIRKLLQEQSAITRQDYIDLVRRLEKDFLDGVQKNLRARVVGNPWINLKMAFSGYSRTQRIGELYEEQIYSRVQDGGGDSPRYINELRVQPKDGPPDFNPKEHNWRRSAKVPILIVNATSVNTGHNWQFTSSWMGEPPAYIDDEVDANYRLRRMYYSDAPEKYKKMRLGYAVGASSCVPGLFEPLPLRGLYPDKVVQLVDGGVHDNQGIASLLEQGCTVVLVSDASGQNGSQDNPSNGILSTLLNANGILMQRVREAQSHDLAARRRSSLLRGRMFIHLKKDLNAQPVDWIDCADPYDASDEARPPETRGPLTRYGILKEVQRRVALVRTDLDSFHDAEAYALMMSGYNMTKFEFDACIAPTLDGFSAAPDAVPAWRFMALRDVVTDADITPAHKRLLELLDISGGMFFKIWKLSRPLQAVAALLGIGAVAALTWAGITYWSHPLLTVGSIATMAIMMVLSAVVGKTLLKIVRWRETLLKFAIGVAACLLGWIGAGAHLLIFDKMYLAAGKLDRVLGKAPVPPVATPRGSRVEV